MIFFKLQDFFYKSYLSSIFTSLFGFFVNVSFPKGIQRFLQYLFVSTLKIKNIDQVYPTLQDCFTRPGSVSDNESEYILSPVEALVQSTGQVEMGKVLQAKGVSYSLSHLLPSDLFISFIDSYYMTLYLSPSDCHRIYAPITGSIHSVHHISGYMRPVREPWLSNQNAVYTQNERVMLHIENDKFDMIMVMVAAFNVGLIDLTFKPFRFKSKKHGDYQNQIFSKPISMKQGQHLATFLLGSTVIIFAREKNHLPSNPFMLTHSVKTAIGDRL